MKTLDEIALEAALITLNADANALLIVTCGNNSAGHVLTGLQRRVADSITQTFIDHEGEPGTDDWFIALQIPGKTEILVKTVVDAFIVQHATATSH